MNRRGRGAQNSAHKKKQGSSILGSVYKVRKGKAESLKNTRELLGMWVRYYKSEVSMFQNSWAKFIFFPIPGCGSMLSLALTLVLLWANLSLEDSWKIRVILGPNDSGFLRTGQSFQVSNECFFHHTSFGTWLGTGQEAGLEHDGDGEVGRKCLLTSEFRSDLKWNMKLGTF